MNINPVIAAPSILALSIIFALWRGDRFQRAPADYVIIVRDISDSVTSGCESVVAIAHTELKRAAADHRHLKVGLMFTGTYATANEPIFIDIPEFVPIRRALEGQSANSVRAAAFLDEVRKRCNDGRPANVSSILLSVKRAVEMAEASGAVRRKIYVQSDLEENTDTSIRRGNASRTFDQKNVIDNARVEICFCGFAETRAFKKTAPGRVTRMTRARTSSAVDRLRSRWSAMFSNPALVTFLPFCARSADGPR
jgi:hypothetical protein